MFYTNRNMVYIVVKIVFLLTARMIPNENETKKMEKMKCYFMAICCRTRSFSSALFIIILSSSSFASLHVADPSKPDPFTHTHYFQECMRYEQRSCDPSCLEYDCINFEHFVMSVRHIALCYVYGTRQTAHILSADVCEPAFSWVLNVGRLVSVFSMFTGYGLWFVNIKLPNEEKNQIFT